jgi:hypothetical protein
MSNWTGEELDKIGSSTELRVAPERADGSLRPYVTIWVVRVGDDLYVRSFRGHDGAWFRSAVQHPHGRIRAGGVDHEVTFEQPEHGDDHVIDQAYRTKYAQYGSAYVDPIVSPSATAATLRLVAS